MILRLLHKERLLRARFFPGTRIIEIAKRLQPRREHVMTRPSRTCPTPCYRINISKVTWLGEILREGDQLLHDDLRRPVQLKLHEGTCRNNSKGKRRHRSRTAHLGATYERPACLYLDPLSSIVPLESKEQAGEAATPPVLPGRDGPDSPKTSSESWTPEM